MIEIPLEILQLEDNSYHLLVDVEVSGIAGKMVLDTGASQTIVDSNLPLPKAILEKEVNPLNRGIGGTFDIEFVQIDFLQIGAFSMTDLVMAAIDLSTINEVYEKATQRSIIGLIGSDLLLKYGAVIDYKKQLLYLLNE